MKKQLAIVAFIGVITLSSVGCGSANAEELNTPIELSTQSVKTLLVKESSIDKNASYNGTLSAINTVHLIASVPGEIISVPTKVGDHVTSDQTLYILDKKDIQRATDNARLQYEAAGHQLTSIKDQHILAKKNFERLKALYEKSNGSALSQADYEQAEKAASNAGVAASKTQLAQAKIGMDQAIDRLNDADLKSPIAGIITKLSVEPGQTVAGGQHIADVVNMDQVYIDIQVSETLINTLEANMVVDAVIPAISPQTFEARIDWVSPAADAQTRLFPVRIILNNDDHLIKPGMFATINLSVTESENALVIPSTAVLQRVDRQIVYVNNEGMAEEKEVVTGFDNGHSTIILSGLSLNDQLIIEGQQFIEAGTPLLINGGE